MDKTGKAENQGSNKQNFSRKRKRKWNGVIPKRKKVTTTSNNDTLFSTSSSSSGRKLSFSEQGCSGMSKEKDDSDFFLFAHFSIIQNMCHALACPDCAGHVDARDDKAKRRGFAHCILIECSCCSWKMSLCSSPDIPKSKSVKGR